MSFDRWWIECTICHREYDLVMEHAIQPVFCCWCGHRLAHGCATNQSEAARRADASRQRQTATLGKYLLAERSPESVAAEDAADEQGDWHVDMARVEPDGSGWHVVQGGDP